MTKSENILQKLAAKQRSHPYLTGAGTGAGAGAAVTGISYLINDHKINKEFEKHPVHALRALPAQREKNPFFKSLGIKTIPARKAVSSKVMTEIHKDMYKAINKALHLGALPAVVTAGTALGLGVAGARQAVSAMRKKKK